MSNIKMEFWKNNRSGNNVCFDTVYMDRETDIVYSILPSVEDEPYFAPYRVVLRFSYLKTIFIPCRDFEDARDIIARISSFINGRCDDAVNTLSITDNSTENAVDIGIICEWSQKEKDRYNHWHRDMMDIKLIADRGANDKYVSLSCRYEDVYTDNPHKIAPYVCRIFNDNTKYSHRRFLNKTDFNFYSVGDSFAPKHVRYTNLSYLNSSEQTTQSLINDMNAMIYNCFKPNIYDDYRIDEYCGEDGNIIKMELYGIYDSDPKDEEGSIEQQLLISLSDGHIEIFVDDEDSDYFIFENNAPKNKEVK